MNDVDWSTLVIPCFMKGVSVLYENAFRVHEQTSCGELNRNRHEYVLVVVMVVVVVGGGVNSQDIQTQLSETQYIQHQTIGPHSDIQVQFVNN